MSIDRDFLHDISNPLSALRVHLEMLVDASKESPNNPNLEALQKCQKLLDKCIDKIQEKKQIILAELANDKV